MIQIIIIHRFLGNPQTNIPKHSLRVQVQELMKTPNTMKSIMSNRTEMIFNMCIKMVRTTLKSFN